MPAELGACHEIWHDAINYPGYGQPSLPQAVVPFAATKSPQVVHLTISTASGITESVSSPGASDLDVFCARPRNLKPYQIAAMIAASTINLGKLNPSMDWF